MAKANENIHDTFILHTSCLKLFYILLIVIGHCMLFMLCPVGQPRSSVERLPNVRKSFPMVAKIKWNFRYNWIINENLEVGQTVELFTSSVNKRVMCQHRPYI